MVERDNSVDGPLRGVRVLVTRGMEQAGATAARLEALGATVLLAPAIQIVPPADWAPLDQALARLGQYRLVVFASRNAVTTFFARLRALGGARMHAAALGALAVAAVGPRTAQALAAEGVTAAVVAAEASAEGLAQALASVEVGAGPVLVPRAAAGRDTLLEWFAAHGVAVDAPVAYRTVAAAPETLGWVGDRLLRGLVDVVIFGSPSAVQALAAALADPARLLDGVLVAAIGPTTTAALQELGVRVDIVPAVHTFDALIDGVVAVVANGNNTRVNQRRKGRIGP